MGLSSQLFRGDSKLEAAAISDPAHIVPGAHGDHVRKIQIALIQLDGAKIATDGFYGPGTAAAVLAYKTKRNIINHAYQSRPDNIVGKMTIAAMDAELPSVDDANAVPAQCLSFSGACEADLAAKGGGGATDVMAPDILTVVRADMLAPKVRVAVTAARFQLLAAGPFITDRGITEPTGPLKHLTGAGIHLLKNVFSLHRLKNPAFGFDNIQRVFANMDVALNRSFGPDPRVTSMLFVPNTSKRLEKKTFAYTAAGGAFMADDRKFKHGAPANRIYVTDHFLNDEIELQQISTLIHELAHYVSGQPIKIEHGHGVPKSGHMLKDRATFDRIAPEAKLRSPEHYAFFALAAGFRRLVPKT